MLSGDDIHEQVDGGTVRLALKYYAMLLCSGLSPAEP
jgi:hypothetical protein